MAQVYQPSYGQKICVWHGRERLIDIESGKVNGQRPLVSCSTVVTDWFPFKSRNIGRPWRQKISQRPKKTSTLVSPLHRFLQ